MKHEFEILTWKRCFYSMGILCLLQCPFVIGQNGKQPMTNQMCGWFSLGFFYYFFYVILRLHIMYILNKYFK